MQMKHTLVALATVSAVLGGIAGTSVPAMAESKLIQIDGSSTVYPITEAVAEEFQKAKKGAVRVTVGISGTGGGFKKFCRGELDIADASRPITSKEMAACKEAGIKYIEMPVAFDALTVVIHKDNTWANEMTVAELKTMWEPDAQGKITNWKQVNPKYPDMPLALFGPGADSGTFEYFTEAVNGKAKSSRGDFTASEDDNVLVQGVARNKGGLGYFGMAYYFENRDKLKAVSIIEKEGKPAVAPSLDTVLKGTYQPLARPIFIYVNEKSAKKPEIKEFIEFYMTQGTNLSKEVGYVPLPAEAYKIALGNFKKNKVGTGFGGHNEVGVRIEDVLKREAKL
jgi:phosphate transport system substrate-binding protein